MKELVIYHADCYDGFTAAWIARQAMPDCDLFEGRYGEPPPMDKVKGRKVFVLDFSYPREQMIAMNEAAEKLEVLDHHKTAETNCEGLDFCTFDMERSGAGMAWDRFFPDFLARDFFDSGARPQWINCVEDRDLWRFKHPMTKAIHAYITTLPMTMEAWDTMHNAAWEVIADQGKSVLNSIDRYCEKMSDHVQGRILFGLPAQVVNAPYLNCSELCNYMLEGTDEPLEIAVAYFQRRDKQWQFSLRSKRGGSDVSAIAKKFGGGGHHNAAGFDVSNLSDVGM